MPPPQPPIESPQAQQEPPTVVAPLVAQPEKPTPADIERELRLSRDDWRRLQQAVTALGFDTRGADGKPGPVTRQAVAEWQRAKRVEVTGYLGPLQRELILAEAKVSSPEVSVPPSEQSILQQPQANLKSQKEGHASNEPNRTVSIVRTLPVIGKVELLPGVTIKVYRSPSFVSPRLGTIGGSVNVIGPSHNGFVIIEYNGIDAYAVRQIIEDNARKQ